MPHTSIFVPTVTHAQFDFQPLVGIPGVTGINLDQYINAVYAMFISIAALIAVVKIIIAGVKYMFSDVVTQKSDAKRDIRNSLLGLTVVLAAVLILNVINPNIPDVDISLDGLEEPEERVTYQTVEEICASGGQ